MVKVADALNVAKNVVPPSGEQTGAHALSVDIYCAPLRITIPLPPAPPLLPGPPGDAAPPAPPPPPKFSVPAVPAAGLLAP